MITSSGRSSRSAAVGPPPFLCSSVIIGSWRLTGWKDLPQIKMDLLFSFHNNKLSLPVCFLVCVAYESSLFMSPSSKFLSFFYMLVLCTSSWSVRVPCLLICSPTSSLSRTVLSWSRGLAPVVRWTWPAGASLTHCKL